MSLRRDALVASGAPYLIIQPDSSGTTGVPLRPPGGPARQVRGTTFDNPTQFCGHDKRAPPTRRDKRAPPPPNSPLLYSHT